jgi:hypothetical protein
MASADIIDRIYASTDYSADLHHSVIINKDNPIAYDSFTYKYKIMKKVSFLILALISLSLYSQDNYMALSFGRTFPQNDFAKSDSIYNNGFANMGFLAEYSGAYFFIDYVGLGGAAKFSSNMIDEEALINEFYSMLPDNTPESTMISSAPGIWKIVSIAAGPHLSYPINRLTIDGYFYLGFNIIYPPKMELAADLGSDGIYSISGDYKNLSLGFDTGMNIKYNLSDAMGIKVFVGYQQSAAKGDLTLYNSIDQGEATNPYSCKIQLINVGIGLVYIL